MAITVLVSYLYSPLLMTKRMLRLFLLINITVLSQTYDIEFIGGRKMVYETANKRNNEFTRRYHFI